MGKKVRNKIQILLGVIAGMSIFLAMPMYAHIVIDFEQDLDGNTFSEGDLISDQFSTLGVSIYLVGSTESPLIVVENGTTVGFSCPSCEDYPDIGRPHNRAYSGENSLTNGTIDANYGFEFSIPVDYVSIKLIDFGDCISVPSGTPVTATLKAWNANGDEVDSDSFTIPKFDTGDPEQCKFATLEVSGPGIVVVETQDVHLDCGTGIDDLTFIPEYDEDEDENSD